METFRSIKRGDLPPVGEAVLTKPENAKFELPNFENYSATWLDSGTSALALALITAKKRAPEITQPEVIVPGYCCPDLVAAAVFAGVRVVVVDISTNDPGYNLHALKPAVNQNTVAIIAVNFLGIREDMEKLIALKFKHPKLCIIEDNAQWFPHHNEFDQLQGDFVVFSFGRGKPVSLLGGGLLLSKFTIDYKIAAPPYAGRWASFKQRLKYIAYNNLLKPQFYQLLNRNPFFELGVTRYHALEKISAMDGVTRSLVMRNLVAYWERSKELADLTKNYDDFFAHSKIHNKLLPMTSSRRKRLLRYPMLFGSLKKREHVFAQLKLSGLGTTEMYACALVDIDGVKDKIHLAGEQKNAIYFAHHFITLPLHSGVAEKHLELIKYFFSNEKHH